MRAYSRGYMKLDPKNPHYDPIIQPNYFEHPQDIIDLRDAVKITRKIFAQKALEPFRGAEIAPGNMSYFWNAAIAFGFMAIATQMIHVIVVYFIVIF